MITIIDYGVGNLGSIYNMFKRVGVKAEVSKGISDIEKAEKILLPGVGSFDTAMEKIGEKGFTEVLNYKALDRKVPVMGICLGMQLLTKKSEEGQMKGLGWIDAETHKFNLADRNLPVPHMGWNSVEKINDTPLSNEFDEEFRFYFVHSYFVKVKSRANLMFESSYGLAFASGIFHENIFGVQFHPEKSHKYGMKLFENFSKI